MLILSAAARNTPGPRLPPSFFASLHFRTLSRIASLALLLFACAVHAQQISLPESRAQHFISQRSTADGSSSAIAFQRARTQAAALLAQPRGVSLTASWQPLGPLSILSPTFGNLTGRITALALDPNDPTGNTLYVGTTGGGVWKSTNAASTSPTFTPLTDTLPVFAAGTGTIPSLSIGALAVQPLNNPVLLAGTGDPNDSTDSYYGEGLLRSADGGLTWTLIPGSHDGANGNHSFAGLSTAAIAFSSATPTLAVAAFTTSPESTTVVATNTFSIPGLYYSTDAGKTWQMSTIMDGAQTVQTPQPPGTGQVGNAVTAVVWDPLRLKFFAAVRTHGFYSSSDGITWMRLAAQPGINLTATKCPVGTNGLGNPSTCPIFRGALAAQPATGDLYALTVDINSLDQGLWQDLCNATAGACSTTAPTFTNRIDNAALEVGGTNTTITQGSYNLTLSAEPSTSNSTLLFAGTIDLYRCAISANSSTCALRNTTNALNGCNAPAMVAPSQHALATLASASPLIFIGNDGGLWRSLDGVAETGSACAATDASHFNNLNASLGSLAEITGFAQHPTDPSTLLAGLGANGSAATSNASAFPAWPQLSPGEGGYPSLDPNTPANWYLAIGAGVNLKQCSLGSSCTAANFTSPATIGAAQVANDTALFDAPTLLDPALTTNLLAATCRVWRGPASSSSTWSTSNAISPAFNGSATPCTATSPLIRSLAAGGPSTASSNAQNSGSEVLYAGIAGTLDGGANIPGHFFVTKSANISPTIWTDIALSSVINDTNAFNYGAFDISSIAVDPHDATGATVYATIMGFGVPHLYRSTDFGAHWANISNNLPDAPANAVLIDPNDANTVYLALDTGVYVTTAVLTCSTATSNCWSPLGTALPNAPVIALSAAAGVPTNDGRIGMLRAATYGRGLWQQPLLTAITTAQPAITLSSTSFTFAAQQVSTQSIAQTLTITSSGNSPVTFGSPIISGDFTETDTCAQQTLAVNSTCTVQISFAPTATGTRTGQLTIYANISGGQSLVTLTGTGTAAASITFTPTSLTFPATLVNQTSAVQNVVVANLGGTPATLQIPVIIGANATDFAISANTCTATLGASTGCTLSVTFKPTASGARTATLSLTDSAGSQTAALTGTGNAPATDTLSATSLTFAQQTIGTTSASQSVTLTNNGDVALTLISTSVTTGDFTVTNTCGNSLAAHSTCAIQVNFIPTVTGARSATLTVTDQFRSQLVVLNGTGVAPAGISLAPTSLTFVPTGVNLTTAAQVLTLFNNGGQTLTISSITASPGFTIAANNCTSSLAINSACALQVVFAPTTPGAVTGAITFLDNATIPTQIVPLSGTGIDFTLAPTGATTATLTDTASATYNLQLTSLSTLSGSVALSCAGAPTNATCTVAPNTASLGNTVPVNVTVLIGTKAQLAPPFPFRNSPHDIGIVLALFFPAVFFFRRRLRNPFLSLAISCCLLFLAATLSGCGAGREIPTDGTPAPTYPTTPGTYNLTVSATSAGLTRTVGLTLIVK